MVCALTQTKASIAVSAAKSGWRTALDKHHPSGSTSSRATAAPMAVRGSARSSGPGTNSKHLVTIMEVAFDDRDTASAPRIAVTGTYTDRPARIGGEWRITERVMTTG
jgi:hypothetical protein